MAQLSAWICDVSSLYEGYVGRSRPDDKSGLWRCDEVPGFDRGHVL